MSSTLFTSTKCQSIIPFFSLSPCTPFTSGVVCPPFTICFVVETSGTIFSPLLLFELLFFSSSFFAYKMEKISIIWLVWYPLVRTIRFDSESHWLVLLFATLHRIGLPRHAIRFSCFLIDYCWFFCSFCWMCFIGSRIIQFWYCLESKRKNEL